MKAWRILLSNGEDWDDENAEIVFADTEGKARAMSESGLPFIEMKAKRMPEFDGFENDDEGLILQMLRIGWFYRVYSQSREATIYGDDMTESNFDELEALLRQETSTAAEEEQQQEKIIDFINGLRKGKKLSNG